MRRRWILSWCLFFPVAILCAEAADTGSLSGVVHDGEGKPLGGVTITLRAGQVSPSVNQKVLNQTISSPAGDYRFADLPPGEYTVGAERSGYAPMTPVVVRIPSASATADLTLILTLIRVSPGSNGASSPHPPLEFQAAGIRGLIDPGGYSASTSGAASGLLRGIADVRRTDKSFSTSAAKNWPCALEPELRKAVAEHPDEVEANRRLGQFYASHDQPARAIPLLQRALQIDGGDYGASRELAIAWLESGEFESARKQLTALAARRPESEALHAEPTVHQLLARADEGSGMFLQAAQEYRVADSEAPSEESLFGVGYELVLAGSVADGVVAFEAGVQRYPQSIALRIGAGTAQFLLGKTSAGLRSFLDATDIDPADPRPYSFVASAVGVWGDQSERVRSSLKRYQERKPDSADANYFYALALSHASAAADADRMERLLKRAILLDPKLARAHLQLADIYAQRNDYENAIPEYEAAVRLAPDLGEAHYRLALAYRRTGRVDQSAREMQIFQVSKERQDAGSEGVDLAQFISVMDSPSASQEQHPGRETECPGSPD